MSDGPEVGQGDTLGGQVLLVRVIGSIAVVLIWSVEFIHYPKKSTHNVFQPDLVETLESDTLHVGDGGRRDGSGSGSLDVSERRLLGGSQLGHGSTSGGEQHDSRLHFHSMECDLDGMVKTAGVVEEGKRKRGKEGKGSARATKVPFIPQRRMHTLVLHMYVQLLPARGRHK